MSDGSYEQEWGSDGDGGWGDDDKEDQRSDTEIEIENNFYTAEADMKDNPTEALEKFECAVMLEENRSEQPFSFKASMYIILIAA